MKSAVALKSCQSYDLNALEAVLTESLSLLGGPSAFFKPGQKVLVKPNLLSDAKPENAITTHPVFVQAVLRILKKIGLKAAIGDIPGEHKLEIKLERVYEATGMQEAAQKEGVRLLTNPKFVEEDGVIFNTWVKEFDHIVSLPKFKTHTLMTLTGAVKNVFGLTPRLYRINLHKRFARPDEFARLLVDVYKKCTPTLSFVDAITAIEGNGPSYGGIPRKVGLIASSSDAFALDSVLTRIAGLEPDDIATNRYGREQKLGAVELEDIDIRGEPLERFLMDDFKLPPAYLVTRLPDSVLKFLSKFAAFRPRVEKAICNGCRVCIENCPISAIELYNKKAGIDYRRCVDCFCCLEVCPKGAMKTKSGPLVYVLKFRQRLKAMIKNLRLREA